MSISKLAESFKTINRPDPTRLDPTRPVPTMTLFDGFFLSKIIENSDVKF